MSSRSSVAPGDELSRYAQPERVEWILLAAALQGEKTVTLVTVSEKEYEVPSAVLPAAGGVR